MGYEIASIDLDAGMVTATFDDGRVLTVDRTGGLFWLVDKDQETIMSGTVAGELVDDDLATASMTYELADEPGVEHVFDGSVVADVTSNGCVILQGTLDADPLDENVDLAEVSYRADGSTASPDRRLAAPPGVVDGETVGDGSGGPRLGAWGWILIIAGAIVLTLVLSSTVSRPPRVGVPGWIPASWDRASPFVRDDGSSTTASHQGSERSRA